MADEPGAAPPAEPGAPGTPNPADVVAGIVAPAEPGTPTPWYYADGVAGQGDVPDYFKADKYASLSDQAKAYKDLESKFGNFTGSPETFEVNLSAELTESGMSINKEDPIFEEAIKFATDNNMNQAGFDNMLNLYATAQLAEHNATGAKQAQEIESLGAGGQERINNLISWGKANLPVDLFEGFEQMPTSASAVKALEQIISMTQSAPITPDTVNGGQGGITDAELNAMQFEKDEHGNRRLQTDPAFKAEFNEKMKQRYGAHDHNVIMGQQ